MKKDNRKKGQLGEKLAADYLIKTKGHRLIQSNYHCSRGEIDLITETGKTLVFSEVKFRRDVRFGLPAQAVDFRKQRHIIQTALWYLHEERIDNKNIRFDVIELIDRDGKYWIRHHENAFQMQ